MWTIYKHNQGLFAELWHLREDQCDSKYLMLMSEWLSKRPARVAGIGDYKGTIAAGKCADFVVFDTREALLANDEIIFIKQCNNCIYRNQIIECEVVATYLRGTLVFKNKKFLAKCGRILLSPQVPSHPLPNP